MTQAIILCGGRGSRLGALTDLCPKPLLRVGDGPFLDILMQQVKRAGCNRVLLLAGYRAEAIERYAVQARVPFDLDIRVSIEPEPLGTGGALRNAIDLLDDTFLVLNGDTFFEVAAHHLEIPEDLEGVVTEALRENVANGGVYAFRRDFVRRIQPGYSRLEYWINLHWRRLRYVTIDAYFVDIGTPTELERARRELPGRDTTTRLREAGSGVHK